VNPNAKARIIEAVAQSLWADYKYTALAPWDHVVRYLGVSEEHVPQPERRVATAANRCLSAARAVFSGLRDCALGDLQEAFLKFEESSPEERAVDIFSPIHVWGDGSGTIAELPAGAGMVVRYHGPVPKTVGWGSFLGNGTNNFAELSAILLGLQSISGVDRLRPVTVHSDSMYALGAASGKNKVTANEELITQIRATVRAFRSVTFRHTPGHSGIQENEWCDKLAGAARTTKGHVTLESILKA